MSEASGILHPGAPASQAARQHSLERIRNLASNAAAGASIGAITDLISDHVNDIEIKAAAIDKICRSYRWAPTVNAFAVAEKLHLPALPRSMRTGRWHWVPKAGVGQRLVCSLSWPLRVAQLLVKDAILAAHVPADHIGDWRGRGPKHHLQRVLEDLQHGSLVFLADVRDCFQSVQPDAVYRLGLLPSDLVESCFDIRRIRLRAPYGGHRSSIGSTFERTGRHGLLSGGSASSLMWAMMIDDLPGVLPAGARAHTYADNIVIVCRSTQECDDAEAALTWYFAEHPAGPFFLYAARADAEAGFDHLGYNIVVQHGGAVLSLKDARLPRFESRTQETVAAVEGLIDETEFERIVTELLGPWPMLSPSSQDALIANIGYECDLHNASFRV